MVIIHEKNTKEIIAVTRVYIWDKTHVDFHKPFTSIFSAYTTSISKILLETMVSHVRQKSTFIFHYIIFWETQLVVWNTLLSVRDTIFAF